MAVVEGIVSFVARSMVSTAAAFSERIGLDPTHTTEVGDARRSGRRQEVAVWSLDRHFGEEEGPEGFHDALLSLLMAFDGRDDQLAELRGDFELSVHCSVTSDSAQGGFWLGPDVTSRLGRLGVDFYCSVYSDEGASAT